MADCGGSGKGDPTGVATTGEVSETNETSNASCSVMDVDDDPPKMTQNDNDSLTCKDGAGKVETTGNTKDKEKLGERKVEEDEFLVVEEDDSGDEQEGEQGNKNTEKIDETFNTPEPEPMDAANSPLEIKVEGKAKTNAEATHDDDDVMLVNPLFGKSNVPVIDIESSSSSSDDDSEEEEDFSLDVAVDNFQLPDGGNDGGVPANGNSTKDGDAKGPAQPRSRGKGCGCDCYHEKGILVNEIERLRRAVFEINERHSVLEDFIEVEYSESFDKFLKNREHLVSMGFGGKDSAGSEDLIDGKRSSKSAELIELLKMIKEQASANIKEETETTSKNSSSSTKGASNSSNQPSKSQSKPKSKPIPSMSSPRDRDRGSGRGGALSYGQRPVIVPSAAAASNAYAMNYQYQQNLMAQQEAQARQYYESMYGHAPPVRDSRDYISAVGRTELYPSSNTSSYSYGYGGRSDSSSNKESKKQRKRKRQSEVSSEGSSKNIPNNPGKGQQQSGSSNKKVDDEDDIEVIDYTQSLNVNAKRICPLCEKIINRKFLRDHLSIVHQGHKVTCPVCQVEFMQRRRIKTHMRDAHDLPTSEYSAYIDKIYNNIEEQCGPWLDKLMKEAEPPTKDQLLVHNAEIQLSLIARRDEKAAAAASAEPTAGGGSTSMKAPAPPSQSSGYSSSRAQHSSSSSSGRRDREHRDRDNRDRGSRGGSSSHSSQSQPVRYFTGANTKVASSKGYGGSQGSGRDMSSAELYGPGGYAQYAARYLQQRAATGSGAPSRIYTPF